MGSKLPIRWHAREYLRTGVDSIICGHPNVPSRATRPQDGLSGVGRQLANWSVGRGARCGNECRKSRSEVQLGKMTPVPSAVTATRARQARTVGNWRCWEAHKKNAIRLPPGTISATAAYAPSTRIGLEDWDSEFIDRSSIAVFRMSCGFPKYTIDAELHVNFSL